MPLMKTRVFLSRNLCLHVALATLVLSCAALPAGAQKPKKDNLQKPLAGPRAAPLRVTWLFIAADTGAQKVDKVQVGREMVIAEKSGPWIRVYANTDVQEVSERDAPIFGHDETPPPVSGWMEARGVVVETTPNGDQVLMGEAANRKGERSLPARSDGRGGDEEDSQVLSAYAAG